MPISKEHITYILSSHKGHNWVKEFLRFPDFWPKLDKFEATILL